MDKRCESLLSIVIPAYNMQDFLARAVESLEPEIAKLDVIIVNDGSTDDTLTVAQSWQEKHPKNITVVDQPNGGHGSAINAGLELARGKYFRVLDADDWLNTKTLSEYLEVLKTTEQDLVITNYSYNYVAEDKIVLSDAFKALKNIAKLEDIKDMSAHDFISMVSIHSCTIKTAALKKVWSEGLLTKTFYEDQEFVAKMILAAESAGAYDLDVYQYMIGRDEQSMSGKKMFAHRADHAKVLIKLIEDYKNCQNSAKQKLLQSRAGEMYKTHYWIYFYHPGLTRKEKAEFKKLKSQILELDPEILQYVKTGFKLQLFLGRHKAMLK